MAWLTKRRPRFNVAHDYSKGQSMKIIHCADIHLDSKLEANLQGEKRKIRKAELLDSLADMVEYAIHHEFDAVIIAGDLFDTAKITRSTLTSVAGLISRNPGLEFYYLKGNHDAERALENELIGCPNFHTFGRTWTTYRIGEEKNITISGAELSADNNDIYNTLMLNPGDFNIVVLHGQNTMYGAKDRAEYIDVSALKNKAIDYLALGHVHKYEEGELDRRGIYCYPGCLEGRGFDECGKHGFVTLDIDERSGKLERRFVVSSKRELYAVEADVSGCADTFAAVSAARRYIEQAGADHKDLVKIVLTGEVSEDISFDTDYIAGQLADEYFFVKVYDRTGVKIDISRYMKDVSLKGEFIRLVYEDEGLDEESRNLIIKTGISALRGEEF